MFARTPSDSLTSFTEFVAVKHEKKQFYCRATA